MNIKDFALPAAKNKKNNSESCSICCEYYNRITRKQITCSKCDYKFCRLCLETYLLADQKNNIGCPNPTCKLEFSIGFLFTNTSKTFVRTKYLDKQAELLQKEQTPMLPLTLENMEMKKKCEIKKKEIQEEINFLKNRIAMLNIDHRTLDVDCSNAENGGNKYIRPCPVANCKGYLSKAWKCCLCETYVCHECGNIKSERTDGLHVCNEDDKKTMAVLRVDTKPCPGCFKPIHKIEGCDQMFCVGCHTVFSWASGKKLLGVVVHNPHYYEYQRSINNGVAPRVAGDDGGNPCAGYDRLPLVYSFRNLRTTMSLNDKILFENAHRSVGHNDLYIEKYTISEFDKLAKYTKFRENYLDPTLQKYNEDVWKNNLKAYIKKTEKTKQAKIVYDMVKIVIIDILVRLLNTRDTIVLKELENLRSYANSQLEIIYENFGTKVHMYNSSFLLV
jgi:hypothetical protein